MDVKTFKYYIVIVFLLPNIIDQFIIAATFFGAFS